MLKKIAPLAWLGLILLSLAALATTAFALLLLLSPSGQDLDGCLTTTMFEVELCAKSSSYVKLGQISPFLKNAVIASEDAAFWDHHGIDWVELQNSFETNLKKGRMARGGSTITQQLAKNVYLSADKSLIRKFREAVIALRLERLYKKEFLLEKYLNVVEFAPGVYGAKAAAQHYFQTTPGNLNIGQSVWLAFLLPNPEKYSISFKNRALTPFAYRQLRAIVDRLFRFKRISDDQRRTGYAEIAVLFGPGSGGAALDLTLENSPEWDGEPAFVEPPIERQEERSERPAPDSAPHAPPPTPALAPGPAPDVSPAEVSPAIEEAPLDAE